MARKAKLALVAIGIILALVAAGCRGPAAGGNTQAPSESATNAPAPAKDQKPVLGAEAPAFKGKQLFTGEEVELPAAAAGRVAILNFFSPG